tara:strand:- start:647 stop:1582 length:936 start_codon:yes stop_codon:yes gene_type:complete
MSNVFLVTGCCGFLGSNMCEFLLKKKYEVIGIDNLLTGSVNNIKYFKRYKTFSFIKHDVIYPIKIDKKIDFILHFASTASPVDYIKYPIKTLRIGSIGTENILKLGLLNNAKVLVASTSEVYGDPLEHPQKETYYGNVNSVGPRGVYDEAKRYLEAITTAYHNKKELDTKIARIFNSYGPKMRKKDGRAIPNFINQMINNENITIYGDGTQTRSFCYVDDTIEGLYKFVKSDYNYPINIGNPKEYTILELVEFIKNLISSNSKIKFSILPENDPKVRKPDITLARKILKWEPKVELNEGLKNTIDYFYNNK